MALDKWSFMIGYLMAISTTMSPNPFIGQAIFKKMVEEFHMTLPSHKELEEIFEMMEFIGKMTNESHTRR